MAGKLIGAGDLSGEPFRLFFPLGWAAGVGGVAMWLFYFAELWPFYPGAAHARVMVLGFMGAFVLGFLGTAAPRMLEVRKLSGGEFWSLVVLWTAGTGLYFGGELRGGDLTFLCLFLAFVGMGARRFPQRKDLPPPAFVLVVWGFVHLLLGLALLAAQPSWGDPVAWYRLGTGLVYQGFLLCPLLGIGTFLFPRLLGFAPLKVTFPGAPVPTPEWWRNARWAFATGLLIFAGFWIEAWGHAGTGGLLRAVAALVFILFTVPFWRPAKAPGCFPAVVKLGLLALLAGAVWAGASAGWRLGGLHVLFMSGFALLTFLVATRVIYGHSGQLGRFQGRMGFIGALAALALIATVVRLLAEAFPQFYIALASASAALWVLAALVWGVRVLPRVAVPDEEE